MDAKRTTARDMRRANRSLLLTRLYREGPLSRQDLVRSTALSQASVSNLAGELIEDGIVEEAGQVESDGGRPRVLLRVAPEYGYVVGFGVGAAVVADGASYRGARSSAGEWGHTTIVYGGRQCRCGARGCLEAYVGAEAVLDRYRLANHGRGAPGADEETAISALLATDS